MSQKCPPGPWGPWGIIFRLFLPIFGPLGAPLGGPWWDPGGPPIGPFLGCCAVGSTFGAIYTGFTKMWLNMV